MTHICGKNQNMLYKNNIKYLVVHCSDTPNDKNISALDIHAMHLGFGWDGIGYHKVISRNGAIENGRPEFWKGAHVKGINENSLGVCLIGRDKFTDEQFLSLEKILKKWKKTYIDSIIIGHRDAVDTKKTCPNFDIKQWCKKRLII